MTKKEIKSLHVGYTIYKSGTINGLVSPVYEYEVISLPTADESTVVVDKQVTCVQVRFIMTDADLKTCHLDRNAAVEEYKEKVIKKLKNLDEEKEYYQKLLEGTK